MRTQNLRLLVIGFFLVLGCWALLFPDAPVTALAETAAPRDEIIEKVADYKTWAQVNMTDNKPGDPATIQMISVFDSTVYGWSIAPVLPGSGRYSPINSTGVPQIYTSQGTTRIIMPNAPIRFEEKEQKNPHEKGSVTFARIFANETALSQLNRDKAVFERGSIIVREKLLKQTDETPELVTVMVKREKGFSPKSNDWEFFVLSGTVDKIVDRERTGSCSKCHVQAKENDFVFKPFNK